MRRLTIAVTSLTASLFAASAFAAPAPAQSTQATIQAPTTMQAAPDPTVHLSAPQAPASCGLFQTCANTKIGLGKGDFLIRLSAIGVITNNTHSSVTVYAPGAHKSQGGTGIPGGNVTISNQVAPEFTFEYFLNDHFSIDAIAASTHHAVKVHNVTALGGAGSRVGSFWILPPTVTLAYHFMPHQRFNPYVGVGITVAFFHNTSTNSNLFNNPHLSPTVGPSFNLGFDYQVAGNWFFNFDVKQILLKAHLRTNGSQGYLPGYRVHAKDSVNPTIVGAGIAYRF